MERWLLKVSGFADEDGNGAKEFAAAVRDWADETGLLDPTAPGGAPPEFVSWGERAVVVCESPAPLANVLWEMCNRFSFGHASLARVPDSGPDGLRVMLGEARQAQQAAGHQPAAVTEAYAHGPSQGPGAQRVDLPSGGAAYACRMPDWAG